MIELSSITAAHEAQSTTPLVKTDGWISGKHVLITGASSGIGREIALNLTGVCARMTLVARDGQGDLSRMTAELDDLAESRQKQSPCLRTDICARSLDVRDNVGAAALIEAIYAGGEQIDAFVNCAGGTHIHGGLESLSADDVDYIFDVNAKAPIQWLKALLPRMKDNRYADQDSKRAHVVMMSSRSGERPLPNLSVYAAAKGAIEKLVDAVRTEYSSFRIVFTVVNPGAVHTAFARRWPDQARRAHRADSMSVAAAVQPIVHALDSKFAVNRISYESVQQWLSEPGVLKK